MVLPDNTALEIHTAADGMALAEGVGKVKVLGVLLALAAVARAASQGSAVWNSSESLASAQGQA